MNIDEFYEQERTGALVATITNMRRCKQAGIRNVIMIDCEGGEFSANPDDYFQMLDVDKPITTQGEPNLLVVRETILLNPLTREVI